MDPIKLIYKYNAVIAKSEVDIPSHPVLKNEFSNNEAFVHQLQKANRVCSIWFAMVIPVKACSCSDLLLPLTTVVVAQNDELSGIVKAILMLLSVIVDGITLSFRVVTWVPRAIYNACCGVNIAASSLTTRLEWAGVSGAYPGSEQEPVLVMHQNTSFLFSAQPTHERLVQAQLSNPATVINYMSSNDPNNTSSEGNSASHPIKKKPLASYSIDAGANVKLDFNLYPISPPSLSDST